MFRDGKWKPAIFVEKLNEPRSYNVKKESESIHRKINNIYWRYKSNEYQTIELWDDEDEAKIVHIKSEDITNM